MNEKESKEILSQLIGGFDGMLDTQVEWGAAIAAHFYNMGWLDGSTSERKIIELQNRLDKEGGETTPELSESLAAIKPGAALSFDPIAGIDFKTGADGLFDSIKVICDDYNEKIRKEKQ